MKINRRHLTAPQRAHLAESKIKSVASLEKAIAHQAQIGIPCWDCLAVAQRLAELGVIVNLPSRG